MVIQGPPGTGKSQTIVNLIAAAVAAGKKVLFVSEKMTALDVVKQRLDKLHLGGPCLELHSNRTNKRTLIEELKRTVSVEKQAAPDLKTELSLLTDSRDKLNAYCKDVNEPIGNTKESPRSAYGKRLNADAALKGMETPALRIDAAANWSAVEAARRQLAVKQLQDRIAVTGIPRQHAFWGSRVTQILPSEKDEMQRLISHARDAVAGMDRASSKLAESCRVAPPSTPTEAFMLLNSATHVLSAPDLASIDRASTEWLSREGEIHETLNLGRRYRDLRSQYDGTLRMEAWSRDVADVRQTCAQLGGKWWRFLSGQWRRAKREITSLCISAAPSKQSDQLILLDAITETARAATRIEAAKDQMTTLFGPGWAGVSSDWDELESKASWVISARRGIQAGSLATWCISQDPQSLDRTNVERRTHECKTEGTVFQSALRAWIEKLQIDEARFETRFFSQSFSALGLRWEGQTNRVDDFQSLVALNQAIAECEADGLEALTPIAWDWVAAGTHLFLLYERARLAAILDRAFTERPSLALFSGETQEQIINHFRRLDILQLEHRAKLISAMHAESLPAGGGNGEIGTLWREFQKRARFLPIRSLILKAGHAIQSIKPVFMMSPLSIANYLPPGALTFDLIIFDEASQVRPVDALGAIARGKQAVVVGDSKQMPPTSFFDSLVDSTDAEDQDEVATSDVESILGLFCARGAHQRMLRWHYRSRHESLITVSNHLFYDDQLVVFPSPQRERNGLGLIYRYLETAHYDRGRTRTNPAEAKAVATAVMAHARTQLTLPKEKRETLGVAAFSISQMTAIEDQLELLRRQNPSCEEFFSYPPHELFFVKNLESVQGDERDVIFISVGYGRTAEGFLGMSFGPLNRAGGERRLNVLISRARKRCEVFTNLKADDIDISATQSIGVASLKTFLHYAETGQLDVAAQTGRPPDSEFEEHILRRLTALGYTVHSQVGSAGFFLDLAVVDPAKPGRYLLGIECDGAAYHSAQSARDRDRLRQAVLEGLGWRIHRIWSTDWFHHPEQELAKVVKAIKSAQAGSPTNQSTPAPMSGSTRPEPTTLKVVPINGFHRNETVIPYAQAQLHINLGSVEMHLVEHGQLAELIAKVVRVESPVHHTDAARRVLNGAGIQRFGSRIQQTFDQAIALGASRKLFVTRNEFLWTAEMKEVPVRDRSKLPAASRKIEFVAPEEIRRAILVVIQESHGIAPEEVAGATCRLLGFTRVTEDMSAVVERNRDVLVREDRLALRGMNLVAVASDVAKGA
jgi:very-short-patch-repair endonuclease